jgi:uncharacterized membrane protein YfcA
VPEPQTWILVISGAFTGFIGAMLGLGGGVFLVPLLALGLQLPIRTAIGASLISVIATASASSTVNLNRGLVNMRLGLVLEVATSVGGLGGGILAAFLTQRQLFLLFGATLIAMGIVVIQRSGQRNVIAEGDAEPGLLGGRIQEDGQDYVYRVKRLPFGLGASLGAGAISGLLGVGGGIVKVPALNTFCGVPIRVAAATSAFMIGVTATASAFVYWNRGDISPAISAGVALGALPAGLLGARLSERFEARSLKILMAVVLLLVGARMGFEGL